MKRIFFIILLLSSFVSYSQVKVFGNLTTNGPALYPTHIDSLGYGGMRVCYDTTERNIITALRRKQGMFVYTQKDSTLWILNDTALSNNWKVFQSGITQAYADNKYASLTLPNHFTNKNYFDSSVSVSQTPYPIVGTLVDSANPLLTTNWSIYNPDSAVNRVTLTPNNVTFAGTGAARKWDNCIEYNNYTPYAKLMMSAVVQNYTRDPETVFGFSTGIGVSANNYRIFIKLSLSTGADSGQVSIGYDSTTNVSRSGNLVLNTHDSVLLQLWKEDLYLRVQATNLVTHDKVTIAVLLQNHLGSGGRLRIIGGSRNSMTVGRISVNSWSRAQGGVIILGTDIDNGVGSTSKNRSYIDYLFQGNDQRYDNASFSYTKAGDALNWIDAVCALHPKYVLVHLGEVERQQAINPATTFRVNLDAIITKIKAAGAIPIMLSLVPSGNGYSSIPYNTQIQATAAAQGVKYIDITTPLGGDVVNQSYTWNQYHPSDSGHILIANTIALAAPELLYEYTDTLSTVKIGNLPTGNETMNLLATDAKGQVYKVPQVEPLLRTLAPYGKILYSDGYKYNYGNLSYDNQYLYFNATQSNQGLAFEDLTNGNYFVPFYNKNYNSFVFKYFGKITNSTSNNGASNTSLNPMIMNMNNGNVTFMAYLGMRDEGAQPSDTNRVFAEFPQVNFWTSARPTARIVSSTFYGYNHATRVSGLPLTNVGIRGEAQGGDINYAGWFGRGDVRIDNNLITPGLPAKGVGDTLGVFWNSTTNMLTRGAIPLSETLIKQTYTSGATVTATNTTTILFINPATVQSALTITMPAAPVDLQKLEIYFGGSVSSGTVVTSLTVAPNTSQILVQPTTPVQPQAGSFISYRYNISNSTWYRIN